MLFSQYSDNRLMFVHRSDKHPSKDDFVEMYLNACEIILPISGNVSFASEGRIYSPKFGDIMIFSPFEIHRTIINSDTAYERIVIQIRSEIFEADSDYNQLFSFFKKLQFGKIGILKSTDLQHTDIKEYIKKLTLIRSDNSKEIIALLLPLLECLKNAIEDGVVTNDPQKNEISTLIVKYINNNLIEDITPDSISAKFHISRSKLDKLFRKKFDTSVWAYIVAKRLRYARSLLQSGEKPTKVALKCGFQDYTAFFKAFKKQYGVSPSQTV